MQALFQTLRQINAYKLAQFFFLACVFAIPFQVQSFLLQSFSYESGLFNPFVTFFIYLSDLFLLLAVIFWGMAIFLQQTAIPVFSIKQKYLTFYILIFLFSLEFSLIFSEYKEVSLFYGLRLLEFFIFYLLFSFRIVSFYALKRVFLFTVLLQSFIGLFQYMGQEDFIFSFLGEPDLGVDTLGVAKLALGGEALIRVYGTFVHPNVFAAFLLLAILLSLFSWSRDPLLYSALLLMFVLVFLFTFSRSAWVALFAAVLFYFSATNKKFPLIYFFLSLSAILFLIVAFDLWPVMSDMLFLRSGIIERFELLDAAKSIFYSNPFGIGLGNFTLIMQDYISVKLAPWDLQPVHNVFFLILVEGGVIAFAAFLFLFIQLFNLVYRLYKQYKRRLLAGTLISIWAAFFVISLFDHYFITLYQGQFLFWIFLSMISYSLELETTPLET